MSRETYDVTSRTYETKYQDGYGLQYPDGHVIRIHRQILEYELQMSGGTILDYGCGSGVHLHYFAQHGYVPYGCDISATAIEQCQRRLSAYAANFHVVPSVPRLRDYFPQAFDLVFSNQVLYYLNDHDLHLVVAQLHELLRPAGVLVATMIAPTNYYAQCVEGTADGLSKVVLRGRLNETTYINFKTPDDVLALFAAHGFEKIQLGYYNLLIREDEGPRDHTLYVGSKPLGRAAARPRP